jgi:tRNA (Thr-GGU) A37 N-methylase
MVQHDIVIQPVGVVRSPQKELAWEAGAQGDSWQARAERERAVTRAVARIEIEPALDGILDGTEEYSHLLVLWWADRGEPRRAGGVKVRPMGRQDLPEVGIFATRSPARPNPILATVVEVAFGRARSPGRSNRSGHGGVALVPDEASTLAGKE